MEDSLWEQILADWGSGQALDRDEVLQALFREPPTYLIVSIDGLTDETNSGYRTGAKLQPALTGVRELAEWKKKRGARLPRLSLRFIAMKHNQHQPQ